jgi:lipid-binding SYLF domain-containing protein
MKRSVSVFLLSGACLLYGAENSDVERLNRAAEVFQEVMNAPDKGIPQDLLDKSECVVIVPGLKKAAFVVGGKFGRGFFSCRTRGGHGWSGPAAVRVEGGSFGFQIGGSETDVIMLVMNRRGAERLLSSKFTLGADASVAAGPVGRTASAETDAYMTAEILTYSRARGLFAGIALSGATLREDLDSNEALYGKKLTNKDIIEGGAAAPPAAAQFVSTLNKYSTRRG